jgi:hypothetical protein
MKSNTARTLQLVIESNRRRRAIAKQLIEDSVWKVEGGCWVWLKSRHPEQYGSVNIDGIDDSAHRVSYEVFTGHRIPDDHSCYHQCGVQACVNPSHLYTGAGKDSNEDNARWRNRLRFVKQIPKAPKKTKPPSYFSPFPYVDDLFE